MSVLCTSWKMRSTDMRNKVLLNRTLHPLKINQQGLEIENVLVFANSSVSRTDQLFEP